VAFWRLPNHGGVSTTPGDLLTTTEVAALLHCSRQNTVFAGLLTDRERLKALAAFDAIHPRPALSA
jgi:hypothetical protein